MTRQTQSVYESPMNLTWDRLPFKSLDELKSMKRDQQEIRVPIMDPTTKTPLEAFMGPMKQIVNEKGLDNVCTIEFEYGYRTGKRNRVKLIGVFEVTSDKKPKYRLTFG